MRAAISYVMANEGLSLDRLRSKFATKMAQSSGRTPPLPSSPAPIVPRRPISAKWPAPAAAAGADTLSDFMQAYRERYPAYSAAMRQKKPDTPATPPAAEAPPATPAPTPAATGAAPTAPPPASAGRS